MNAQSVERLGYVVMAVPDLERSTRFYRNVGHLNLQDTGGNSAFLGGGFDHHWLRLQQDDQRRGLVRVGFQLSGPDALDAVADRLTARGVAHTEIGDIDGDAIDRGLRFTDPDGVEVDVFTDMLSRAVKPTQEFVRMTTMLHTVWFSDDPVKAHEFYANVLGFRASDWIKRNAVFMRAGNLYHHSLGIFKGSPQRSGTMDHFCVLVDSIDDVMRARNIAIRHGAPIQKDVLRHAASGSISVYVADPEAGVSMEFCTEHAVVEPDHRPRMLDSSPVTRDLWMAAPRGADLPAESPLGVTTAPGDARVAEVANTLA